MKFQRINYSREEQKRYLEKSEVKNYVILDDDSDMLLSQKEHFVKTSWNTGLLEEHTEQAIKILTTPLNCFLRYSIVIPILHDEDTTIFASVFFYNSIKTSNTG